MKIGQMLVNVLDLSGAKNTDDFTEYLKMIEQSNETIWNGDTILDNKKIPYKISALSIRPTAMTLVIYVFLA